MRAAPTLLAFLLPAALLVSACSHDDAPQPTAEVAAAALADARALLAVDRKADPLAALARLTATFGTAPRDPEAAFLLARAAFRSEEPARCTLALDAYFACAAERLAAHADWTAEAWVLRGWLLERAGRPEEALPHYEKSLTVSPDYAFALLRKGCALADAGDVKGAIAAIEQAIARRPALLEAHFTLARLLRRDGRDADADRETRIHRLLNQTSDNTANTRESVLEKFAAFAELEQLLPQWIEGRLALTQMQVKLGQVDVALERMRRLVADHPESAEANALLEQIERARR